MTANKQQYVPDASGTVYVKGQEELARSFVIKDQSLKMLKGELEDAKEKVRAFAESVLMAAAEGA